MKLKNVEDVMDKFRREDYVKVGGCIKFFRKWIQSFSTFPWFPRRSSIPQKQTGAIQIPLPNPINFELEIQNHI